MDFQGGRNGGQLQSGLQWALGLGAEPELLGIHGAGGPHGSDDGPETQQGLWNMVGTRI